jgi:hypothetical protein
MGRINPAGDLPRLDEEAGLRVDSVAETEIQISRGLVRRATQIRLAPLTRRTSLKNAA